MKDRYTVIDSEAFVLGRFNDEHMAMLFQTIVEKQHDIETYIVDEFYDSEPCCPYGSFAGEN
jgi:hypothetical protein